MRSNTCPKCHGSMAEGFIATEKSGMKAVSSWYEGAPQKSFWGLRLHGKPVDIATWRCNRCGYLENYAVR